MREDGRGGEHLVVDELVPLRRLHHAIQREHAPEAAVLEQLQALMLGLAVVDDLVGLQRQPAMRMQALLYPSAHRPLPRRCSATTTCDGLKPARRTTTARCGSAADRKSVGSGKSVAVSVVFSGRRSLKKQKQQRKL